MEWTGLNDVREKFLSFFESKGHTRLKSYPLIPQGDNSLLLINSGMAPMKKYFLGQETPPSKRVTTCQKCIRTPDIERVGKTSRHGTFFEMLGNFSFGDYFKVEAIEWAWEFITEVIKLPTDRLWISIYLDDDEAFDIWTKHIGVPAERIVRLGKEDNFWEHGSGPCGPCSEIYFDRGEEHGCGSPDCGVGCDCDRFVEFWNLVFSQFDSDGNGNYERMDHPNIDTGMGLERLACILQGVDNLFEVDTVKNIMSHISKIAGVKYKQDEKTDVSLRVITDHIRSTVFMVSDGVMPSNEGRGYVLRRLLRRAARHGVMLGIKDAFLYKVVDTVIKENESAYPELREKSVYIKKVIKTEEESFAKTINKGIEILGEIIDLIESDQVNGGVLSGEDAFRLYDTFGFPIDLTKEIIAEHGIEVDEESFVKLMQEQRDRARSARASSDTDAWADDALGFLGDTPTEFIGYSELICDDAKVVSIIKNGECAESACSGEDVVIVLDKTPMYAESGGQTADKGVITCADCEIAIDDVKKTGNGHYLHSGTVKSGSIQCGNTVKAECNRQFRAGVKRAHTAAHLLQAALRKVLGEHVHQAGQLVEPDRLRFDFSHFSAMTKQEIDEVERLINQVILDALDVKVFETDIESARKLGAMALFGEKYGDVVRVVDVNGFSIELCGGTHVENTAKIGLFKVVSESSVASGVRRIEGAVGQGVLELLNSANQTIYQAASVFKLQNPSELVNKCRSVNEELRQKIKELNSLNDKFAARKIDELFDGAVDCGGVKIVSTVFNNAKIDSLRKVGDTIKERNPLVVAVLATINEGKGTILCVCGKEAVEKGAHAGNVVREVAALVGGKGGGRPDSAMAGVSDIFRIDEALAQLSAIIGKMLTD